MDSNRPRIRTPARGAFLATGMREFSGWLLRLFRQPIFVFVTIWGHGLIFLGALAFYLLERHANPQPITLFHAYYWAISTATTVGSSDLAPVTTGGRAVAIATMIFGSLFLWSYTALFAASFVAPAVRKLGREVEEVEHDVLTDQATLRQLLAELREFNRKADHENGRVRHS